MQTGILFLKQTFGAAGSGGKHLYKCVPYNKSEEPIYIPYKIQLGFSKVSVPKYITYVRNPTDSRRGTLQEELGDVNDKEALYQYLVLSKLPHVSLKKLSHKIKTAVEPTWFDKPTRTVYAFTIDNHDTIDFDDAFSIKQDGDATILSIYISNVARKIQTYDAWSELFSGHVATIYLPNKKISMLPEVLSQACSLTTGEIRDVIALDLTIRNKQIESYHFEETQIRVGSNFVYESPHLFKSPEYQQLREVSPDGLDSHDIVAHWMQVYCAYAATQLRVTNDGIFLHNMPKQFASTSDTAFFDRWYYTGKRGYYLYDETELNDYVHITSPIRRLVDIVNQGLLTGILASGIPYPWLYHLDELNSRMRAIRRVQMTCIAMNMCLGDPTIMDPFYRGVVLDVSDEIDHNGQYRYTVYLTDLKLITNYQSSNVLVIGDYYEFKMFVFQDEYQIKKKIKLLRIT